MPEFRSDLNHLKSCHQMSFIHCLPTLLLDVIISTFIICTFQIKFLVCLLPSATKLRRSCFYRRVSVHGGGVPDQVQPPGQGTHPPRPGTHPRTRYTPTTSGAPPGIRYTRRTRYTPQTRHTPQPSSLPRNQVHPQTRYSPPDQVHPSGPGTPPRPGTAPQPGTPPTRYTPRDQVHPPGPGTPPRTRYTPPGTRYTHPAEIRPLLRTVRILLECILVFMLLLNFLLMDESHEKSLPLVKDQNKNKNIK